MEHDQDRAPFYDRQHVGVEASRKFPDLKPRAPSTHHTRPSPVLLLSSPSRRSTRQHAYALFEHLDVDGDHRVSSWELARHLPSVSVPDILDHASTHKSIVADSTKSAAREPLPDSCRGATEGARKE